MARGHRAGQRGEGEDNPRLLSVGCWVAGFLSCWVAIGLAAQQEPKEKKAGDSGIRKLSRSERKERIKNLPEKYRQFLQDVEPIILPQEVDAFLVLESDAQRDAFIDDFWRRRDRASGKSNFASRDLYYIRLAEAKEKYRNAASDRSRIFLIHGEPLDVITAECDKYLQPIELWSYGLRDPQWPQTLIFYRPRNSSDYRLWMRTENLDADLAEILSEYAISQFRDVQNAVHFVFYESAGGTTQAFISKITQCEHGIEILAAIDEHSVKRSTMYRVFDPPKIEKEDIGRILRAAVIPTPGAGKLTADFSVRYPAKQGNRTDAEMTLLVPRSQLKVKEVGDTSSYTLDVTGELLKNDEMFESFRYRFDFPSDVKDEKLPVVIERFLRPAEYKARIKIIDANSGAEVIVENMINVPETFDLAEKARKAEATGTVTSLKEAIESNDTQLRIVPMTEELLTGFQQIETIAVGDEIKAVEFYLDGKKVAVKRQPPYTFNLDFGNTPQARRVRAVALDAKGRIVAGDEVVLNAGNDPFRVHIVSPRVAVNLKGKTRVEMDVRVPEGKQLAEVQLFLNDEKIATLYGPPFVQTVDVPPSDGVSYLRALAMLKDDPTPPVEDLVMLNTPQFMEEVNVHLVELPTTVTIDGRPKNDLPESAFKVLDEGKPVKVARFEYVKNLPLSLGIAMDTSGSMLARMDQAQKTASNFLKTVMKTGDRAFLVAFDSEAQLIQKWSPNVSDMSASLAKLRAEEYTALYDAVVYSLYNFLGVRGQKALILITDGKDTRSKFTFDQALEYARRAAVPIYAIGIAIRAAELDVRYQLGKLTAETGGNVYYIDKTEELRQIYDDIQNELRSQYVLGFYPPEGIKPGSKWREVSVQVSEGKAKTIRGYYP